MNTMTYVNGNFYLAGRSEPLAPFEVAERWNSNQILLNKFKESAARHYQEQQEKASQYENRV